MCACYYVGMYLCDYQRMYCGDLCYIGVCNICVPVRVCVCIHANVDVSYAYVITDL